MKKLLNLFTYCGVSKDEYESVKKDAYVNNFRVWKWLHVFMIVVFGVITLESIIYNGLEAEAMLRMAVLSYSIIVTILFHTVIKEDSLTGQLIIYLSMIILLLATFRMAFEEKEMMAVSFVVMLVLMSMFMIDKPYFMTIVISVAAAVYIAHAAAFKDVVMRKDIINVIGYSVVGIIINVFYNSIRIREFLLAKQTKDYIAEQNAAIKEKKELNDALLKMSESLIDVLGDIVEGRDENSGDHIKRVKGFTFILANQVMKDLPEYKLDRYTVNMMTSASALHDVGKISIPDSVLLKPGKLTAEEFALMKTHCDKGCDILKKMEGRWKQDYLDMGMEICGMHHEKWDGRGYPKGLKGDEIPISAQIVSIADCYDALTTKRVYKDAYAPETAFNMILNGECGAFSEKLMSCFEKCKEIFIEHSERPDRLILPELNFEISASGNDYIVGIHDQEKASRERKQLKEEISIISSLSDKFYYICYVDMVSNEVYRYKADAEFEKIIGECTERESGKKIDWLLNKVIHPDDYDYFRSMTSRESAVEKLAKKGSMAVGFRICLRDGTHHCRMKISLDPSDKNAAVIGIMNIDEEHERELVGLRMKHELEESRIELENKEKLQDRLAVIESISSNYDYVCSLNAETMEVTVYKAEAWIHQMFSNLEDIVVSPEVRNETLKGIIHPEDFETFKEASKHENVMKGLAAGNGIYFVTYRAYKFGKLLRYQTKYYLDRENQKRVIIGLHSIDI